MYKIGKDEITNMGGGMNYIDCECFLSSNYLFYFSKLEVTTMEDVRETIPAGTYTLSADVIETTGTGSTCLVMVYYDDGTTLEKEMRISAKSVELNVTKPANRVRIYSQSGYSASNGITTTFTGLRMEAK